MPATKGRRGGGQCRERDMVGPPPGLQQTKTSQLVTALGAKKTFEYPPAQGEVLVIMRYKKSIDRSIRNCLIRMKGRIRQPGTEGRCLGLTNEVHVLETTPDSDWSLRDDWCIALFLFPSLKHTQRWYDSEPELKQHDFLPSSDGVQLFAMHLRYLPQPGKMTFHWMELHNVRSKSYLQQEFVDKMAALLDDHQVNHGVVFVQDTGSPTQLFRLKDSWLTHNDDAYCVVNVFDSKEHFHSVFGKENYAQLRAKRGEVCDTVSLLFTIDSSITGQPSPRT